MKKTLLLVAAFIFVGQGCASTQPADSSLSTTDSPPSTSQKKQVKAPSFTLQDFDGNTVRLEDFAGQPLVINSWAAWCPFCKKELVDFAEVQQEFGDEITIIAIDRAESLETAKAFTDERGITDDLVYLLDPRDSFYRSIGGFSMPETIFVDTDGNIAFHKRGPMSKEEVTKRIQDLLTQ